jgi:hypothetical protein
VQIRTNLYPYRLILSRREPVQLTVDIKNDQREDRAYSIEVNVPRSLGLERAGAKMQDYKLLGDFAPMQEKRIYYDIFHKAAVDAESYPINVFVHEHPKGSREVKRTVSRRIDLIIQDK